MNVAGLAIVVPAYDVSSGMSGIGLRAWEFAEVAALRMPVTIIARSDSDLRADNITILTLKDVALSELIRKNVAFLFYDMADTKIMLAAHRAARIILSDCSVPIEHLEFHKIRAGAQPDCEYRELINRFKLQALLTDHFILRSSVYRATLTVALSLIGRLRYQHYDRSSALEHLFSYVPVGFNGPSARHSQSVAQSAPTVDFIWSGGIWDFYDPVALVEAAEMLERMGTPVTIRFMYPPPKGQVLKEAQRLYRAVTDLGVGHLVTFVDCPPGHYARDGIIKSGTALVCLARDGIENYTSVRLRVRDSFLYRKPLIVDKYGATGDLVSQLQIGLAIDPTDVTDIAQSLLTLKTEKMRVCEFVRNIDKVRSEYEIDAGVLRITDSILSGRRALDIDSEYHQGLVSSLLASHPELEQSPEYPF